jgi:hypothetical protein
MDNKNWLEVNQAEKAKAKVKEEARLEAKEKVEAEAKTKAETIEKVVVVVSLKTEVRLEMEGSIKVKHDKKVELEGEKTKETAKLVAEKKTEKAGIEAEMSKYKYVEHFNVNDQPLKETASRDGCASNQLAEAKAEREEN